MSWAPFLAPHRSDGEARERFRASGGTVYHQIPGVPVQSVGTTSLPGANIDAYWPVYLSSPAVMDQLVIGVTTAATSQNARFGLYRADRTWQPLGAPLADSGSVSLGTTGIKTYTPGTPVYLASGRYLTVMNFDGGSPVFRAWVGSLPPTPINPSDGSVGSTSCVFRMYVTRTYAAFPTPGTAWTTTAGSSTGVWHPVAIRMSAA